jgi:hypothetical protein
MTATHPELIIGWRDGRGYERCDLSVRQATQFELVINMRCSG